MEHRTQTTVRERKSDDGMVEWCRNKRAVRKQENGAAPHHYSRCLYPQSIVVIRFQTALLFPHYFSVSTPLSNLHTALSTTPLFPHCCLCSVLYIHPTLSHRPSAVRLPITLVDLLMLKNLNIKQ